MPKFEVHWSANGTAVVEADDADEAGELITEAITNFETVMLDSVDVEETEVIDTQLAEDDED